MDNKETEIDYYQRNPAKLKAYKKHIVRLYGQDFYKDICTAILNKRPKTRYKYGLLVHRLTEKQPLHTLKGIEGRAFAGMHVDHVVSITHAYQLGWNAEQCADISNLQMLTNAENLEKGCNSYCKWPK